MEQVDSSDGGNDILRSLAPTKQTMAMPALIAVPLMPPHSPKPLQRPASDPVDAAGAAIRAPELHGSSSETTRPTNNMRMSSPTRTSLPIAIGPIMHSGAARKSDGIPQTRHQAERPTSWAGSSMHSPTYSAMPYGEPVEPPTTTASEVVYPRATRTASGSGSCDSLGSDGASGAGGSICGIAPCGNPPSAISDQAPPRSAVQRSASPPPLPKTSSPTPQQKQLLLDDRAMLVEGRDAEGEDKELKPPQDKGAAEGRPSASEGGAVTGTAAAGENQESVPNLEEIIAALPPGPIHVTVAVRVGAGGGRRPRGGGARVAEEDTRSGYMRGHARGIFDVPRYLAGRDCIHNGNKWMSRSNFEKVGGSKMAKWYRSIRVLPELEPLGEWLERHGVPVAKGPARRSRKKAAESGDEQGGQGAEDEALDPGSQEEGLDEGAAPMMIDPAVAPMPQTAPAAVTGLPPLSSLRPLSSQSQLPAQAASAAAAAAAASRSSGQAAARPAAAAMGPALPQSDAEPTPHFPLEVLAERLLPPPRRNTDRKFLQALLNTLPEQLLQQRSAAHPDSPDAKDEDDHDFYGQQDAYLDYGSYAAARSHGPTRAGSGSLGVAYPATSVRAKAMSSALSSDTAALSSASARAAGASDAKALVAAAAAAAHYHRGNDVAPADSTAEVHNTRLRLRALQRLFSSSDPLSTPTPTLQLDLQHPRDPSEGLESGSRGGRRSLMVAYSEQQRQLQQLLHRQQQQQQEQQHRQQQQQQELQQLVAGGKELLSYFTDESEAHVDDADDGMTHMGSGGVVDLTRARADPPQLSLPPLLRRALSAVPVQQGTRIRRFGSSESVLDGALGLEAASRGFLTQTTTGPATARGTATSNNAAAIRPERRIQVPLQAPTTSTLLESAAALARELAVLQGLDLAAAGLGAPTHDHVPRAAALAPHSYSARSLAAPVRSYRHAPEPDQPPSSAHEGGFTSGDMCQRETSPIRGALFAPGDVCSRGGGAVTAGALPLLRRGRKRWLDDRKEEEHDDDDGNDEEAEADQAAWQHANKLRSEASRAASARFLARLQAELQGHPSQNGQQRQQQQQTNHQQQQQQQQQQEQQQQQQRGRVHGEGQEPFQQLGAYDPMDVDQYTGLERASRLCDSQCRRGRGVAGFEAGKRDEDEAEGGEEMVEYWAEGLKRRRNGRSVGDLKSDHIPPTQVQVPVPVQRPQLQPTRPQAFYGAPRAMKVGGHGASGALWRTSRPSNLPVEPQTRLVEWPLQRTRSDEESLSK